jgi:hypothetical protein
MFLVNFVTQEQLSLWLKSITKKGRLVFLSVFRNWQRHFWITASYATSSKSYMKKLVVITHSHTINLFIELLLELELPVQLQKMMVKIAPGLSKQALW